MQKNQITIFAKNHKTIFPKKKSRKTIFAVNPKAIFAAIIIKQGFAKMIMNPFLQKKSYLQKFEKSFKKIRAMQKIKEHKKTHNFLHFT